MNTILASIKKSFENCANRLPDKRNIENFELFSKHVIHDMEGKMFHIANKPSSCEEELKNEDKQTIRAKKEIQRLGMCLNLLHPLKTSLKKVPNTMFLRILKMKRTKKTKKVWVAK
jgi:hypothetical protein